MLRTPFLASKQSQLCAKCENLLHFEENWGLYRICWRYFDVYTLLPFHFTRRMLCSPFLASKEADLCEKWEHLLDFEENWELFRFVVDISTFIRYFHFLFRAECYVLQLHRRKKQICANNATIYSILKKTERYFAFVGHISTFKLYFHCILHTDCCARRF